MDKEPEGKTEREKGRDRQAGRSEQGRGRDPFPRCCGISAQAFQSSDPCQSCLPGGSAMLRLTCGTRRHLRILVSVPITQDSLSGLLIRNIDELP